MKRMDNIKKMFSEPKNKNREIGHMRLWASDEKDLFPFSVSGFKHHLCTPVIHVVSYMLTGLAGCSVNPGISCGACKLARTPQVTKNKNREIGMENLIYDL